MAKAKKTPVSKGTKKSTETPANVPAKKTAAKTTTSATKKTAPKKAASSKLKAPKKYSKGLQPALTSYFVKDLSKPKIVTEDTTPILAESTDKVEPAKGTTDSPAET